VPVKYFVVKNCGDAESRVFDEPLLNRVGKFCSLAWIFLFSLARDLSNAMFHDFRGFFRREVSAVCFEITWRLDLWATTPKTSQLCDFFFERHSRKQIGNPPFDWQTRILVIRELGVHARNRQT
jgi:hypothetical protein